MAETLLFPYDGSPGADRALELLAGYRGSTALQTVVLNVQAPPAALFPEAAVAESRIEEILLESGRRFARPAAARLAAGGMKAEPAVRLARPADAILHEAQARHAAAIVMGTRGHGAMHGFALGSVALRVAHGGKTPVWVVQPDTRLPASFGRSLRVLLAMDGSEPALRTAELLCAWRSWLGELEIHVAYVQPPLSLAEEVLPPHDDLVEQWSTRSGEAATQAARELFAREKVAHRVHYSAGDPAAELALLAQQTGCEAMALGTRGLGAAHHAFVGSVALKAAARSPVPVLLAK